MFKNLLIIDNNILNIFIIFVKNINMRRFVNKIKSYFFKPIDVQGEEFVVGFKTILPNSNINPKYNTLTHGDRVRYFDNYNVDLLNKISEIKSLNS